MGTTSSTNSDKDDAMDLEEDVMDWDPTPLATTVQAHAMELDDEEMDWEDPTPTTGPWLPTKDDDELDWETVPEDPTDPTTGPWLPTNATLPSLTATPTFAIPTMANQSSINLAWLVPTMATTTASPTTESPTTKSPETVVGDSTVQAPTEAPTGALKSTESVVGDSTVQAPTEAPTGALKSTESVVGDSGTFLHSYRLNQKLCLTVAQGSVVNFSSSKGAIVNAANQKCLGGSGVDGIITQAGGENLHRDRLALPLMGKGIRCPTGDARVTGPGQYGSLQVPFIIHAVGPNYKNHSGTPHHLVRSAYQNAMNCALGKPIERIGFSLLSAGVFRGNQNLETVLTIGVEALRDWSKDEDKMAHSLVEEVVLYAFTDDEAETLVAVCDRILGANTMTASPTANINVPPVEDDEFLDDSRGEIHVSQLLQPSIAPLLALSIQRQEALQDDVEFIFVQDSKGVIHAPPMEISVIEDSDAGSEAGSFWRPEDDDDSAFLSDGLSAWGFGEDSDDDMGEVPVWLDSDSESGTVVRAALKDIVYQCPPSPFGQDSGMGVTPTEDLAAVAAAPTEAWWEDFCGLPQHVPQEELDHDARATAWFEVICGLPQPEVARQDELDAGLEEICIRLALRTLFPRFKDLYNLGGYPTYQRRKATSDP